MLFLKRFPFYLFKGPQQAPLPSSCRIVAMKTVVFCNCCKYSPIWCCVNPFFPLSSISWFDHIQAQVKCFANFIIYHMKISHLYEMVMCPTFHTMNIINSIYLFIYTLQTSDCRIFSLWRIFVWKYLLVKKRLPFGASY